MTKINNTSQPKIPKKAVIVVLSLFAGLFITGVIGVLFFDHDTRTEDQKKSAAIMEKYPNVKDLLKAIDDGTFDKDNLSDELRSYLYFESTNQTQFIIDSFYNGD